MPTKQTIEQVQKQEAFKAIDHALNKIFEYSHLVEDAAWEIGEHLKNNNVLKDAQRTLVTGIDLATPNHETKRLCLGSALYHANDNTVTDLLQFLNQVERLSDFVTEHAAPNSHEFIVAEHVKEDRRSMHREVESELAQRVELYRQDIGQLKEQEAAE